MPGNAFYSGHSNGKVYVWLVYSTENKETDWPICHFNPKGRMIAAPNRQTLGPPFVYGLAREVLRRGHGCRAWCRFRRWRGELAGGEPWKHWANPGGLAGWLDQGLHTGTLRVNLDHELVKQRV